MPQDSKEACRLPAVASVADAPGSPGVSNQAVARPPNKAKLHQGKASLPWLPCWPGCRPAKIDAARAGVIVIALMAEIIMDAEIVSANWRKNWPVMLPRKALG